LHAPPWLSLIDAVGAIVRSHPGKKLDYSLLQQLYGELSSSALSEAKEVGEAVERALKQNVGGECRNGNGLPLNQLIGSGVRRATSRQERMNEDRCYNDN